MSKQDWVTPVRRVEKPWGHEEIFALVDGKFCGKAIHVTAGHALTRINTTPIKRITLCQVRVIGASPLRRQAPPLVG